MTYRKRLCRAILFGAIIMTFFLAGVTALAQQENPIQAAASQTAQSQTAPSEAASLQSGEKKQDEQKKEEQKQEEIQPSGTSKDRLFYTLPNFLSVPNAPLAPLTPAEKFKVVTRGAFDPVEFAWYAALAGIGQAENSESGYGQGAAGYGKRFGATVADGTIENYMTGAVLPTLLRQDPRFFQLGKGSFWHRTGYAMSRIFVTRTDAGGQQFNFSEIFGSALSAGISTYSYHPHADKTLANTASVWGTQVGYDTLSIVVKEFWPDIKRKIHRKRQGDGTAP